MKIIQIISLFAFLAVSVSCNMDKLPYSAIETGSAIENVSDCQKLRIGLYSGMKSRASGSNVFASDYQADIIHAMKNFGNWGGQFYSWTFATSEDEPETAWNGYYLTINNANFLIEGVDRLLASGAFTPAEVDKLNLFRGEAYFLRAFSYYELALKFCKAYDPKSVESDELGLPLVTKYAPTSISGNYPARSNMVLTFNRIEDDMKMAEESIKVKGAANSAYLNEDIVKAFKARLYLTMHKYTEALNAADYFVDSETYPLVTDQAKYKAMWVNDISTEVIWAVTNTITSIGNSSGPHYIYDNGSGVNPQYIPEKWLIDSYSAGDIRFSAFFEKKTFEIPVQGTAFLFTKFPGNPSLYSGSVSNYKNMPKVFRAAEMYLIAAEASEGKGESVPASIYLNKLKKARIPNWVDREYTGTDLTDEIRNERARELCGEGFRLYDLKRWGLGLKRSEAQDPAIVFDGATMVRDSKDYRFVWPIPQSEINANPQIKLKQNPGY